MKHIKHINEYRTIGFRYSEPKLRFLISCNYSGEVEKEDISDILDKLNTKFDSINITDSSISFDIFIYNEREINDILSKFSELMYSFFDTITDNFQVKEHRDNLKV